MSGTLHAAGIRPEKPIFHGSVQDPPREPVCLVRLRRAGMRGLLLCVPDAPRFGRESAESDEIENLRRSAATLALVNGPSDLTRGVALTLLGELANVTEERDRLLLELNKLGLA